MAGGAGRKKKGGHEGAHNEERWLLPYADMITLLLALFIMLYATSNSDVVKMEALSQSVAKAFNGENPAPQASTGRPSALNQAASRHLLNQGVSLAQIRQSLELSTQRRREDDGLKKLKKKIEGAAKEAGLKSKLSASVEERGLVIRLLSDNVLFNTGEANLTSRSLLLLNPITRLLKQEPNSMRVEGHTDNVPIRTSQFASNWELSSVRASTVVRFMIRGGFSPERLSAVGYAHTEPRASNATASGRASNRRVEIVVLRSTLRLSSTE